MSETRLREFVYESNRIEGIVRVPTKAELWAHVEFLELSGIGVEDLRRFVNAVANDAPLREREGMDVRVSRHVPPRGGAAIATELTALLYKINQRQISAFEAHVAYETLHPFMDGNGRSGRVLWLWMMGGVDNVPLGFLHTWYYESLDAERRVRAA